jgi:hypothetical protein
MIALCARSVALAAALFLIGILLGLALHVISPATTYSSRNSSTVVVVSVPAATSADGDVLR